VKARSVCELIKTFISHTSSDHPFVEWLKTKLERENLGLDIFVDDGPVSVGDDPQKMIDEVSAAFLNCRNSGGFKMFS